MKKERKNLYEGMYVINSTLSEEARGRAIEKIEGQIVDAGGEIHKRHDWGRRKLAYEIDGKREGNYYILYFSAPTQAITELWKEYHLNEDLVRFVTLRTEKVAEEIEFKPLVAEKV